LPILKATPNIFLKPPLFLLVGTQVAEVRYLTKSREQQPPCNDGSCQGTVLSIAFLQLEIYLNGEFLLAKTSGEYDIVSYVT
jgi:hypothetical protein